MASCHPMDCDALWRNNSRPRSPGDFVADDNTGRRLLLRLVLNRRSKIYVFVVFHRVYHPAFAGGVPYLVAIVELQEGPRMLTNIVGVAIDQVHCNIPVSVAFDDVSNEVAVPKFRPQPK